MFVGNFIKCSLLNIKYFYNFFLGLRIQLKNLIIGIIIFDLEKNPFSISKISKSNGTYCVLIENINDFNLIKIKLPSLKYYFLNKNCFCSIGRNNLIMWKFSKFKKASYYIKNGFKQKVRGVAMNPVDHPHGGRTKTNKPEVSIWGWVTKYSH